MLEPATCNDPYHPALCSVASQGKKALDCFNEVINSTRETEPDCLIYRYYRSEVGEGNTFFWIGKYVGPFTNFMPLVVVIAGSACVAVTKMLPGT